MPTPIHSLSMRARRPRWYAGVIASLAALSGCDIADLSGISSIPCIGCPVTTRLEIHGDSVVAVGDAIVLRAVAFQQTILFDFRYLPMQDATWDSPSRTAIEIIVPKASAGDTATWGRAVVLGRDVGIATVKARADGHEATKYVRVIAAP